MKISQSILTIQPSLVDVVRFALLLQIVHEMLREHKVDVVFGYPGGAILPVYDAIHESPHFQ